MTSAASPAADFSLAILGEFVALGVTDAVLAPGSRSQALALALAEFHRARMLDLQVRVDERVAGFTALGLAAETGSPAIVVTTSGTAVANLLPAVLEAHHSSVPMLLLTSDRPAAMRGTAGNQTTWQPDLFGGFVRRAFDVPAPSGDAAEPGLAASIARLAVDAALGTHTGVPGPVHVNLQFREPLSGAMPDLVALLQSGEWMPGVAVPTKRSAVPVPREARGAAGAGAGAGAGAPAAPTGPAALAVPAGRAALIAPAAPAAPTGPAGLDVGRGPLTVVIAGHGAGPAAEELAHQGGWPLVAEPSSGSRYGRNLVVAYRELLNDAEFGGRVERAIVFGHPTLAREVPALSLGEDVETIVVTPAAGAAAAAVMATGRPAGLGFVDVYNPGRRVRAFATEVRFVEGSRGPGASVDTDPDTDDGDFAGLRTDGATRDGDDIAAEPADVVARDREWLRAWVLASRALLEAQNDDDPVAAPNIEFANSPDLIERREYRLTETAAMRAPITRRTLALAVWQATWPHDRLVLGASRLIRDLDRAVAGKKIRVHANRGLAGIDGTISTATGIALASQRDPSALRAVRTSGVMDRDANGPAGARATHADASAQHGVTRVLLGDLTLLHDVGALLFGTGEARPRIQVVVANDGGGTIFDTLEVGATADRAAFDRVMLTPQAVDLESLARAYGWAYSRASTRPELDRELTAPIVGPSILEVPLER